MVEISPKKSTILIVLLIINLMFSATVIMVDVFEGLSEADTREQYTLYIGTNDKDTNLQEIPFDECRITVENACLQYFDGITVVEGYGVWTDDLGNTVREQTLICYINGATAADIDAVVEQLLVELNQSSILIEHQNVKYTYRSR